MTAPIRILHFFGKMTRGGAETRTVELMRAMDEKRFEHQFVALKGLRGELDDEIVSHGGKVHYLRLGPSFPLRLALLQRRYRFDVAHSHVHYASGMYLHLARLLRIPVRIAQFHTTNSGKRVGLTRKLQQLLMRRLIKNNATWVLAVSRAVMEASWRGEWRHDHRFRVVYNGHDTAAFEQAADRDGVRAEMGVASDAPLFIHVGSFREPKNHPRLVSIFASIARFAPDARLVLVGDGEERVKREVARLARDLDITDSVIATGSRGDVPRLLLAADVMLMPSLWEGLPGAVVEACAAGLPVIASDIPAHREIAEHFPSVMPRPLGDADDYWALAAIEALGIERPNNPHAEVAASPFSLAKAAEELATIYSSVRQGKSEL